MKDSEIKKILEQDSSIPNAPKQEWSNILNKIDKENNNEVSRFFSLQALTATLGVFLIITVSFNYLGNTEKSNRMSEKSAVQFIIEDSYLGQDQDSYGWVDSF